jgi:hypothetical protein
MSLSLNSTAIEYLREIVGSIVCSHRIAMISYGDKLEVRFAQRFDVLVKASAKLI